MTSALPPKRSVKKPVAAMLAKPAVTAKPAAVAKPAGVAKTVATKPPVIKKATPSVRPRLPAKAKANSSIAFPKSSPEVGAIPEIKEKIKKAKLVRDSFTMPEIEYAALGEVKKNCLKAGFEVKKSELLRIGVALIRDLDLAALKVAAAALSPLKPGRPRKEK